MLKKVIFYKTVLLGYFFYFFGTSVESAYG